MVPDAYQGAMEPPIPGDPARRAFLLRAGALSLGFVPFFARGADAPKGPATPTKSERDPYADAVFVPGEPPLPAEDAFTFAVLPDTQF